MKAQEILRLQPKFRVGYALNSISGTTFRLADLKIFKRLQRIPAKITAYLNRDKIREVYKSDCFKEDCDNYYIIRATDDTLFHVDF